MRRTVILLIAAPLALAACGSGSKSSQVKLSAAAYVKQAAAKSAQATSEHVDLNGSAAVQGQQVVITGSGDFDNSTHQGSMTAHATVSGLDLQIDEVLDGTNLYMKSPLFAATLPAGKTWLKLDLQKLGQARGIDFRALLSQNPSQAFTQLQAIGNVTTVGDETIGGAATTHYSVTIDPSKLPSAVKLKLPAGAKLPTYDVWIGKDDGYIHRSTVTYANGKQSATVTSNFTDFGKTVTVDVPPAGQVVDATAKSLKGLGG
jgi:membrane-associated protease RseP (regulator of RpoE activity)